MNDNLRQINDKLHHYGDSVIDEIRDDFEDAMRNSSPQDIYRAFVEGNDYLRGLIAYYIYKNFVSEHIAVAQYAVDNDLILSYRLLAAIPANTAGLDELIHKSLESSHYMNIETALGMIKERKVVEYSAKIKTLMQHPNESVALFASEILDSIE